MFLTKEEQTRRLWIYDKIMESLRLCRQAIANIDDSYFKALALAELGGITHNFADIEQARQLVDKIFKGGQYRTAVQAAITIASIRIKIECKDFDGAYEVIRGIDKDYLKRNAIMEIMKMVNVTIAVGTPLTLFADNCEKLDIAEISRKLEALRERIEVCKVFGWEDFNAAKKIALVLAASIT